MGTSNTSPSGTPSSQVSWEGLDRPFPEGPHPRNTERSQNWQDLPPSLLTLPVLMEKLQQHSHLITETAHRPSCRARAVLSLWKGLIP